MINDLDAELIEDTLNQ
jgi:hypothetical protein